MMAGDASWAHQPFKRPYSSTPHWEKNGWGGGGAEGLDAVYPFIRLVTVLTLTRPRKLNLAWHECLLGNDYAKESFKIMAYLQILLLNNCLAGLIRSCLLDTCRPRKYTPTIFCSDFDELASLATTGGTRPPQSPPWRRYCMASTIIMNTPFTPNNILC